MILWFIFSLTSGLLEALLFHTYNNYAFLFKSKYGFDIHLLFVLIRAFFAIPLIYLSEYPPLLFLFMLFSFPFLHDGMYYQMRKFLSEGRIYKKGWFDQSESTSAILSLGAWWRLMFFMLALGLIPVLL